MEYPSVLPSQDWRQKCEPQDPFLRVWIVYPIYSLPSPRQLFLRTLLLSPDRETLANHVRSLTVKAVYPTCDVLPGLTSPDIILLTDAASCRGFNGYPLTTRGAQLVLVLHFLPRLKRLDLRDVRHGLGISYLNDSLLQCPVPLPLALQKICEFRYSDNWGSGISAKILVSLMTLPSIRKIVATVSDEDPDTEAIATAAATTSCITNLGLVHPGTAQASLAAILRIPKALTRLSYTSGPAHYHFDLPSFGKALATLQGSLQHLCLDFSATKPLDAKYKVEDAEGEMYLYDRIGSLREWSALQSLRCPLMALIGRAPIPDDSNSLRLSDILPPGLSVLQIDTDLHWLAEEVVDEVVRLLEEGEISALRHVGVGTGRRILDVGVKERPRLACEESGVRLMGGWEDRLVHAT